MQESVPCTRAFIGFSATKPNETCGVYSAVGDRSYKRSDLGRKQNACSLQAQARTTDMMPVSGDSLSANTQSAPRNSACTVVARTDPSNRRPTNLYDFNFALIS